MALSMLPVAPTNVEPVVAVPQFGALIFPLTAGPGHALQRGRQVTLQFRVQDDQGHELASTAKRGMPYTLVLGQQGSDQVLGAILAGAKYGEQRMVFCDSDLAYGAHGAPAIIPKSRALTFYMRVMMPPKAARNAVAAEQQPRR
jgi:FKBP-type peptidyl-prolyl cis-trans isomerase